jgi:hypothetical protein
MKMRWIILTDIINVPKICDIIEMIQFCGIFETACEISDCTSGVIKRNKKTVSMSNNISSERHLSKGLFFILVAKITSRARFEENVVYIAKVTGEISNFVCFLYFHDHPPAPAMGDLLLRNPITGNACCARAASGHATAAPPSSVMKSRRLTWTMGSPAARTPAG